MFLHTMSVLKMILKYIFQHQNVVSAILHRNITLFYIFHVYRVYPSDLLSVEFILQESLALTYTIYANIAIFYLNGLTFQMWVIE